MTLPFFLCQSRSRGNYLRLPGIWRFFVVSVAKPMIGEDADRAPDALQQECVRTAEFCWIPPAVTSSMVDPAGCNAVSEKGAGFISGAGKK